MPHTVDGYIEANRERYWEESIEKLPATKSMHPPKFVRGMFDWYSPRYQSWHTHHEVFCWFKDNGLFEVEVLAPSVSQIGRKAYDGGATARSTQSPMP